LSNYRWRNKPFLNSESTLARVIPMNLNLRKKGNPYYLKSNKWAFFLIGYNVRSARNRAFSSKIEIDFKLNNLIVEELNKSI
jgi:hypothetical protein